MLKLYYQFFKICTCITFKTESSCPSSFTSFIALTCHVVTCSFFYTMSCALLTAVNAIPSFSTFYLYKTHSSSLKWFNFIKIGQIKENHKQFELFRGTICYLTCFTINSTPPNFTRGTHSTLYVTCIVFTVGGTRCVTVITVDTGIITSCIME